MLLVESVSAVEMDSYRRVMCFELLEGGLPWYTHYELLENLGTWEGKQVTAMDAWRLMKQAPWEEADITLV